MRNCADTSTWKVRMQSRWNLYNKEDKLRVDDLTQEQVKTILLAIPSSRMAHWYACRGGDVHWHCLTEIPEFYEDVRAFRGVQDDAPTAPPQVAASPTQPKQSSPPPVPGNEQKETNQRALFEAGDLTSPTLAVELANTRERRSARRYKCRLEFKVIQGGKSFLSETQDVSMTGMALKDGLPTWLPKTFRAQVSLNGQALSIVAARIDKADSTRLKIIESESWDVLRRWIANF